MSRAKAEAFKNLKLDDSFFQRLLRRECINLPEGVEEDFDIFLMEKGVMAVLLQGLDALSRHVEKMSNKAELCGGPSGGNRPDFNPLVWLAQYILRNHPAHVKDHRAPIYRHFAELADVERGRRSLLRRRKEFEEEWYAMEAEHGRGALGPRDVERLVERLDAKWNLQGAFAQCMPQDLEARLRPEDGTEGLLFVDFWAWFEDFVLGEDLLRASAFREAEERQRKAEEEHKRAQEELRQMEKMKHEALELRKSLGEQFEAVSADMYINDEINRIINKGAILEVEEREGSPPTRGEHATLIAEMLRLWGFPVERDQEPPAEEEEEKDEEEEEASAEKAEGAAAPPEAASAQPLDVWDAAAQEAWECWSQMHGPGTPQVDSLGLRGLIDREAFEDYLVRAHPVRLRPTEAEEEEGEEPGTPRIVEIRGLAADDPAGLTAEAVDEESGAPLRLALREAQAVEVRRRLQHLEENEDAPPLRARVDTVGHGIAELLAADPQAAVAHPGGEEGAP